MTHPVEIAASGQKKKRGPYRKRPKEGRRSQHSDLVDSLYAAEFLNISMRTLETLVSDNKIEVVKVADRVRRYRLSHLQDYLKRRTLKAAGMEVAR
jgi:excisionase family DNA binding protein